ncbi:hypothetical protein GCM10027449_03950 [Sinomonas notoginsengisoli]|uniref:hypothetical protein n=1 Tax=Sinomonas notoginsengisoli TaxID=1457311 RepID=UPI001F30E9D5|nr:hypothetical protein [Sinomonas notoginsengisoli]
MFEFNLQTAVFFGIVALGGLLFAVGVLAFIGAAVMMGAVRCLMRSTEVVQERLNHDRSQAAG